MGIFDSIKKIVSGDVAHDAADSGNPIKIGGKAASSAPAAVSAGDRVNAYFDTAGRLVVSEDQLRALLPAALGQTTKAGSLSVVLASDQTAITTGATDDAAVAGQIYPMAGIYQTVESDGQVDKIDAGDIGRARVTSRRAQVVSPDRKYDLFYSGYSQPDTDCEISTTYIYGTYSAPTTAFFDGADGGFTNAPRYMRIPMINYNACTIMVRNTLGVNLTADLFLVTYIENNIMNQAPSIGQIVIATNTVGLITGASVGAGAETTKILSVPAMNTPCYALILKLVPASDPSSGMLMVGVNRSSL